MFEFLFSRKPKMTPKARPLGTGFRPRLENLEDRRTPAIIAPAGVELTPVTFSKVKVQWTDVEGETGYNVFRWDGTNVIEAGSVAANVTSLEVDGLKQNPQHYFYVEAFDEVSSARTPWQQVVTPSEPLTAPGNLKATALSTSSVKLTWSDAEGEKSYNIYQWDGKATSKVGTAKANATTYTIKNLKPGATYSFYVESQNQNGTAPTNWTEVKTKSLVVTLPTSFTATAKSPTSVLLTWKDSIGESGYRIYQYVGTNPKLIATLGANVTKHQVNNLTQGTTYHFYVEAFNVNAAVTTAWKAVVTPFVGPLTAPANFTAQKTGAGRVRLTWKASEQAAGYRVFVWNGSSWGLYKTLSNTLSNYSLNVTGLASPKMYWFLVQAFRTGDTQAVNAPIRFVNA